MRFRVLCAILAACLIPQQAAFSQGTILQSGPWAPGHVPMYSVPAGGSTAFVLDSGPASGGVAGLGLSELLLQARGSGTPPYANSGTGPLGTNLCDYDAPVNNPTGYHYICLGANSAGGGLLVYGAGGVASPLPFQIDVNGNFFTFPNVFSCINGQTGALSPGCVSAASSSGRQNISVPTIYYVNSSGNASAPCGSFTCAPGSDGNTGLTPSSPWQHAQFGVNYVANNIIFNNVSTIVQLADGTYNENVTLLPVVGSYNRDSGALTTSVAQPALQGNNSNPNNVIICAPAGQDVAMNGSFGGEWTLTGVKLVSTCGAPNGIVLDWSSNMTLGSVTFATTGTGLNVRYGSQLEILGGATVTVASNMGVFAAASYHGTIISHGVNAVTIVMSGTPTFSGSFVNADSQSLIDFTETLFSGNANGFRFFFGGTSFGVNPPAIYGYPGSLAGLFANRQVYGGNVSGFMWVNGAGTPSPCGSAPATPTTCSVGSDTAGDGQSPARPWATLNHAIAWIYANVDSVGQGVYLEVADGTYTAGFQAIGQLPGGGLLNLVGDTTTPDNCFINVGGGDAFDVGNFAVVHMSGFKMSAAANAIQAFEDGLLVINGPMDFSTSGVHLLATLGGQIEIASNYTISGQANTHFSASQGGLLYNGGTITITTANTPAFAGGFATAAELGNIHIDHRNTTFAGSGATGDYYIANLNGVINTDGGGGTFFPGSVSGTTATGGQYN